MAYRYLDELTWADTAFEAEGATLEEVLSEAARATMNVMVEDLSAILPRERREVRIEAKSIEDLAHRFLDQFVYFKDADGLFLLPEKIHAENGGENFTLSATLAGETIDYSRHGVLTDVKAVTLHRFRVWQEAGRWRCTTIVDV